MVFWRILELDVVSTMRSYEEMWEFPDDTRLELCEFWSRSLPCKKPVVMKQRLAARKPENSSNLRFFPAGEILLQLVKAWKTFHGLRTSSHGLPWLMISSLALFILFFCQVKCKHNLIFRCGLPWRIFHRAVQPQCDTQWLAMGDSKDWVFLPEERRLGGVLDLWRMQGFNSVLILKHYQEAMWSQTRHWRDKYLKRLWCAWWTFSRRWACWWPALKKWQVHISLEDPSTVDERDVADWKTLASIQKLQFWLDGGWIPCCHLDFTEATHPGK